MSKTATAQRKLLARRPLVGDQYLVSMKVLADELFGKSNPLSIEDCLSDAVVLRLRQLAGQIEAEVAGDSDVVSACGRRCNSADDTRRTGAPRGSLVEDGCRIRAEQHTSGEELVLESLRSVVQSSQGFCGSLIVCNNAGRHLAVWEEADEGDRFEVSFGPAERDPEVAAVFIADALERSLDGGEKIDDRAGITGNSMPVDRDVALAKLCHCSSPVVAEPEAATSDAPAMTVQESGSSDAAPSAGGVSPAPSAPRFVAVGYHVYDRELHRTATFGGVSGAEYARDCFNEGEPFDRYKWEEAR